ncbi:hypothetical protein [Streptomyces sp. URMC 124]|uniref:hypothetical protein n=1 Tax=Streptomyces sp. URMC 124 TaxID=3423405 RepID=UPI003F1BF297
MLALLLTAGCSSADNDTEDPVAKQDRKEFTVVYEVTGDSVKTMTFGDDTGRGPSSRSVDEPSLPWRKRVTMKGIATSPHISLILGQKGGRADCAISVDGKEVKRATARGEFGTATCIAPSPTGQDGPR